MTTDVWVYADWQDFAEPARVGLLRAAMLKRWASRAASRKEWLRRLTFNGERDRANYPQSPYACGQRPGA